jgi:hypothetical protein
MRVAIIGLAHERCSQMVRLARAVSRPEVRVYLHVDCRAPLAPFAVALRSTQRPTPRSSSSWLVAPGFVTPAAAGARG